MYRSHRYSHNDIWYKCTLGSVYVYILNIKTRRKCKCRISCSPSTVGDPFGDLLTLAWKLYSKGLISRDVRDQARQDSRSVEQQGSCLFSELESRVASDETALTPPLHSEGFRRPSHGRDVPEVKGCQRYVWRGW